MTVLQTMMIETGPHVFSVIKPADETRAVAAITADSDLQFTARANTLYEVRIGAYFTAGALNQVCRPQCTVSVDHAAIRTTKTAGSIADGWPQGTANTAMTNIYDTAQFNAPTNLHLISTPQHVLMLGMVKMGASPGTLSLAWGNVSPITTSNTCKAGSWLFAREVEQV